MLLSATWAGPGNPFTLTYSAAVELVGAAPPLSAYTAPAGVEYELISAMASGTNFTAELAASLGSGPPGRFSLNNTAGTLRGVASGLPVASLTNHTYSAP